MRFAVLTNKYLVSQKNVQAFFDQIARGTAPEKFTLEHLKSLGFSSSNDRAYIPLLKDLGFLTSDGIPTQRYHDYRDRSRSRKVMASALREAYSDIFHVNEFPSESDRKSITGKFKSTHNSTDRVASLQAATFLSLLKLADLKSGTESQQTSDSSESAPPDGGDVNHESNLGASDGGAINLKYNIEIRLPATKDIEVFHAIFRALREEILGR